ncbi:UNVERIFIED_CONTAM: hypothetical protein FKN15_057456 [Acipenser sinensis]
MAVIDILTSAVGENPHDAKHPTEETGLDQGQIPTADDKKEEKKEKRHLQKKSKAKKMKKNKPSPAIASSTHCWASTKVLEYLGPWWKIDIPATVCIGQTTALDLNTEGPVKGPYTVYKGNLRKSKVVYSNEIVSNCPPRPYVIPDDQSYLFCNSDNGTALLLVSNVTLEHNSKFTVEYTTQNDKPGSKETSLQVNSTECPSKMTNEDSHNDTNTQSNLDEGPNIPDIPATVCIGQTTALDMNTEGPVKGPYAVYKGNFRNGKVVYSNEIVSNCPPRPYVIPDDQSYLFCNSDNGTALLLVSNVTLEHNSKFTVEYTTQNDKPGSKETSLQVNSTETCLGMLRVTRTCELSRSAKVTIINRMCHGLSFLHDKNIVHQDLKPDNIMIEYGTFRPVLVDFGVAKITSSTGFSTATNIGNEAYAAPEVFQDSDRNKSTNIWTMGKIN